MDTPLGQEPEFLTPDQSGHVAGEKPRLDVLEHQESFSEPVHNVRHAHEVMAPLAAPVSVTPSFISSASNQDNGGRVPPAVRQASQEVSIPYARGRGESIFFFQRTLLFKRSR